MAKQGVRTVQAEEQGLRRSQVGSRQVKLRSGMSESRSSQWQGGQNMVQMTVLEATAGSMSAQRSNLPKGCLNLTSKRSKESPILGLTGTLQGEMRSIEGHNRANRGIGTK